jgi:hypothetical protein
MSNYSTSELPFGRGSSKQISNLTKYHNIYLCENDMFIFCEMLNYYLSGFRSTNNKVHNKIPNRSNLSNEDRYRFVCKQIKRCIFSRFSDLSVEDKSFQSYINLLTNYVNNIIKYPDEYWKHFTNKQYNVNIANEIKNIVNNTNNINKRKQNYYILTHISIIYSLIKLYLIIDKLYKQNIELSNYEIRFTRNNNYNIQYNNILKKCDQIPDMNKIQKQIFYLTKSIYDIYYGTYVFTIYMSNFGLEPYKFICNFCSCGCLVGNEVHEHKINRHYMSD